MCVGCQLPTANIAPTTSVPVNKFTKSLLFKLSIKHAASSAGTYGNVLMVRCITFTCGCFMFHKQMGSLASTVYCKPQE